MSQVLEHLIDVHHHVLPPEYVAALKSIGIGDAAIGYPLPEWSPQSSLQTMDEHGIDTSILSVSAPGVYFKDSSFSRDLSRVCNEYSARLATDHPGRFAAFASLPLPDVDGALIELEYALDELRVAGLGLLTNVQGHYLGNPEYRELYQELNRRGSVVLVHPTDAPFGNVIGAKVPTPVIEFPLDTTRTVGNLLWGEVLEDFPNIRFIFAHAGGAVPYLASRYTILYGLRKNKDLDYGIRLLQRQYYETALSANKYALGSLTEFVKPSQILFGTDYSFAPALQIEWMKNGLREFSRLGAADLVAIGQANALALFPDLKRKDNDSPSVDRSCLDGQREQDVGAQTNPEGGSSCQSKRTRQP